MKNILEQLQPKNPIYCQFTVEYPNPKKAVVEIFIEGGCRSYILCYKQPQFCYMQQLCEKVKKNGFIKNAYEKKIVKGTKGPSVNDDMLFFLNFHHPPLRKNGQIKAKSRCKKHHCHNTLLSLLPQQKSNDVWTTPKPLSKYH